MSETISRSELLGGRLPLPEFAQVLGYADPRPIRSFILNHAVPFVVIDRVMHIRPEDFRAALERSATSTAPRTRGRPKKATSQAA
ncbi:MAG TPA: hypothetical protein VNC39_09440 [Acidocella sp.]|jgi:hypothetical protein|uniref:hypothetical protein n=1 Tax=Acidocella sp. TaxID=50710 RepID=UPI002BA0FDB3|nr:hypothetical protein [Acidocella sp.]HVE22190.1 hypothetical protein [Acidocella sp.]